MWTLPLIVLVSLAPAANEDLTVDGSSFGPRLTLTCSWFTNFENSRLEACKTAAGARVLPDGGASIKCSRQVCEQLDGEARRATKSESSETPSGTFVVRFEGRVSLKPHKSRYIGDGARMVLVEKLLDVEPQ